MIILNKKLSLTFLVIGLLSSVFLIVDLTVDLFNNVGDDNRLITLSVILVSSMIFFNNWILQESYRNKLKRFMLILFLAVIVDNIAIISYSLTDILDNDRYLNLFISLGLTITVLLYLMFYKRKIVWNNKRYSSRAPS